MFTGSDVVALRQKTGAGILDCKKALTETDGDMDKAVDYLREKGIATAAKKAGRIAAEGVCYAEVKGNTAVLVEVNCESDFVSKGEMFLAFVKEVAAYIFEHDVKDVEEVIEAMKGKTTEAIQKIGENIKIRRYEKYVSDQAISTYIHMGGKIGVLVNLAVDGGIDATEIGKNVAMQIAALNPRFWDKSQVTDEVLAEEKKIALALMDTDPKMASKPEAVKEKIVMGKMNKFYEENCLLQMEFVRGDIFQGSVEKYIADAAKKLGGSVKFVDAVRFQTGEGIEKKQEDFAAEVAAQMNMGK